MVEHLSIGLGFHEKATSGLWDGMLKYEDHFWEPEPGLGITLDGELIYFSLFSTLNS